MRKKISNYEFSADYLCGLSQIHMKMFKDYSALLIYTRATTVGLPPSQEITRHFIRLEHYDLIEEKKLCI